MKNYRYLIIEIIVVVVRLSTLVQNLISNLGLALLITTSVSSNLQTDLNIHIQARMLTCHLKTFSETSVV